MPDTSMYLLRLARRLRPGRSPVARGSDRIEAAALVIVVLLSLLTIPVVVTHGQRSYAHNRQIAEEAMASRYETTATLLADAPSRPRAGRGPVSENGTRAQARWTTSEGIELTGAVPASSGMSAGSEVPIWIDTAGEVTSSPATPQDAAGHAAATAIATWLIVVGALSAAFWLLRAGLDQHRYAHWAHEWARLNTGHGPP
ncbi:hypothetical protein DI005_21550 [Prauserella sp. PE36]|uniref:Uncharacterized protein n=5 Tax=Pseudonocardiaceae TaxID=2070 RepID=A0A2V4AEP7_9PSEU|nr:MULTISPECIES: hypothetical protein [Pseudonocardiaceae]PXY18047.1 hypothetical protein BAY60_33655 [Prauserella muralis]PXY18477.1 hypothetical protein BAY59_34190 [Prauserella coralliicola]MBE1579616.1 hypothetical protein [Amycolatopsis roodepoortensis]RBM17665.1 hypothetical protein DI005_21550 [Prauserella sp. PE36]TKG57672.1 hypothetical protein FCN18_38800 [Prauserella endophytica]